MKKPLVLLSISITFPLLFSISNVLGFDFSSLENSVSDYTLDIAGYEINPEILPDIFEKPKE